MGRKKGKKSFDCGFISLFDDIPRKQRQIIWEAGTNSLRLQKDGAQCILWTSLKKAILGSYCNLPQGLLGVDNLGLPKDSPGESPLPTQQKSKWVSFLPFTFYPQKTWEPWTSL